MPSIHPAIHAHVAAHFPPPSHASSHALPCHAHPITLHYLLTEAARARRTGPPFPRRCLTHSTGNGLVTVVRGSSAVCLLRRQRLTWDVRALNLANRPLHAPHCTLLLYRNTRLYRVGVLERCRPDYSSPSITLRPGILVPPPTCLSHIYHCTTNLVTT